MGVSCVTTVLDEGKASKLAEDEEVKSDKGIALEAVVLESVRVWVLEPVEVEEPGSAVVAEPIDSKVDISFELVPIVLGGDIDELDEDGTRIEE